MRATATASGLALAALALASCAREAPVSGQGAADGPADTRVVGATGLDTRLQSFTVRRQGRLMRVEFYRLGQGAVRAVVTSPGGRGVDRADARVAYDAAFEAARQVDCGGQKLLVDPDSADFAEPDRRTVLTQGGSAWIFQARCG